MKDVGGRGDGIGTEEELQPGLLGCCHQSVGCGFVAGDVHIAAGHLVARLDAIGGGHGSMGIAAIVVASLDDPDIVFGNGGLLLELLTKEAERQFEVTVEEPADKAQGKHITAFQYRLVVHTRISETVFHHLRYRTGHHTVGIDAEFQQVVVALKLCLLQVGRTKGIGVDDDGGLRLRIAQLRLQGSGIHGYQDVAEVAGSQRLTFGDMHLKAAHTRQRTLWSSDVSRIVGKCRYAIAN